VSGELAQALTGYRPIEVSFEAYQRPQSRIARKRLYLLTVFYATYSMIVLLLGPRSAYPLIGLISYLAGIPVWSLVEYSFHRYVLNGRFPPVMQERVRRLNGRLSSRASPAAAASSRSLSPRFVS